MSTEPHRVARLVLHSSGVAMACGDCGKPVVALHADEIEPVLGVLGCSLCDFETVADEDGSDMLLQHFRNRHRNPKWRLRR